MQEELPIEHYRQCRKWHGPDAASRPCWQHLGKSPHPPTGAMNRAGDDRSLKELLFPILAAGGGGKQRSLEPPKYCFVRNLSPLQVRHVKAVKSGALFGGDTRQCDIHLGTRTTDQHFI